MGSPMEQRSSYLIRQEPVLPQQLIRMPGVDQVVHIRMHHYVRVPDSVRIMLQQRIKLPRVRHPREILVFSFYIFKQSFLINNRVKMIEEFSMSVMLGEDLDPIHNKSGPDPKENRIRIQTRFLLLKKFDLIILYFNFCQ